MSKNAQRQDDDDVGEDNQLKMYIDCIGKQLEEVDLLTSIYCSNGEMQILDASVISDFNEFLKAAEKAAAAKVISAWECLKLLKAHLDYTIKLSVQHENKPIKLDVRIELPHLYSLIEDAIVIIHTPLLSKAKEIYFKREIEQYVANMDKQESAYIFQVLSWVQEQFELLLHRDANEFVTTSSGPQEEIPIDFERLWIYSHHIKSKTKRREILKQARNCNLSGFSRPGKPGIICVEGEREHAQEFWRIIRSMHWQKIGICKSETATNTRNKLAQWRRFEDFKEQLFSVDADSEEESQQCVMNMSLFLKFLETHKSGYMKKELFGLV